MRFCKKVFLFLLLNALIFGFVSCNESVEQKNSPVSPENIEFKVPTFQAPRLKGLSTSKTISYETIANLEWAEFVSEISFPLISGFNYSPVQSEYVYEIFGEEVRLILQNDRKERFWGYWSDNDWWNTSKYVFEGQSESIYIKIEMSKDFKTCTYLSAIETFHGYSDDKMLNITYSDNISISKDGSCTKGFLTVMQSVVWLDREGNVDQKLLMANPVDWYCDKDLNGLLFYNPIEEDRYRKSVWVDESDLAWMDSSASKDNVEKYLDFLSKNYGKPDVRYLTSDIILKDPSTGAIKYDSLFNESDSNFPDGYYFDVVQKYLKDTYSENWSLQLKPQTSDVDYCTVHFIIPESLSDIINIPDQRVKKFGHVQEPDLIDLWKSEYIIKDPMKDYTFEVSWKETEDWENWDFKKDKVWKEELSLKLFLSSSPMQYCAEYYDFDGNIINQNNTFSEEVYFPKFTDDVEYWYWLVEWYEGTELKTLKRYPLSEPLIWSSDIGEDVYYVKIKAVEERYFTVKFNTKGFGNAQSNQIIEQGKKVTKPTDPKATGAIFKGWYKDSDYTTEWDFDTDTITARTTIYAKWEMVSAYKIVVNQDSTYGYYCTTDANPTNSSDFSRKSTLEEVESAIGTKVPVFGQAGGYVFYKLVDGKDGYKGQYEDCSYLEVSQENLTSGGWKQVVFGFYRNSSNASNLFVNGLTEYDDNCTKTEIGTGRKNTILLRDAMGNRPYEMLSGGFRLSAKFLPVATLCLEYSVGIYKDWFLPSKEELRFIYENLDKNGIGNLSNGGPYWSSSEDSSNPSSAWEYSFASGKPSSRTRDWYIGVRACRAF